MALPIILAQSVTSKGALKIENTTMCREIFAHFLVKYGRNRKNHVCSFSSCFLMPLTVAVKFTTEEKSILAHKSGLFSQCRILPEKIFSPGLPNCMGLQLNYVSCLNTSEY